MAKGWVSVDFYNTNTEVETPVEKNRKMRKFDNLIRKTSSLSISNLNNQAQADFVKQQAEEDQLLEAYNEKKLKSKALIERAKAIKKQRDKMKAREAKVAEPVAS